MHEGAPSAAADSPSLQKTIGLPVWLFQAFVIVLLVAKVAHTLIVPATEDESYYWLWGQHLDLSYFDNAPVVGWMMAVYSRLLGWNLVALRLGNYLTLIGIALIFLHWAKRLVPHDWQRAFWATFAVYLATPMIFAITSLAYPDAYLIFFCFLSAHFFGVCFAAQIDDGTLRTRELYLGALFLGLAALAKYNAVLLGAGVVLTVILTPKLRPLLRSPHLYLAALMSLLVLLPILVWNAQHNFLSLRFQLYERHGAGTFEHINWIELLRWAIYVVVASSPFLFVPLVAMLVRKPQGGLLGALHRIGKPTIVLSFLPSLYIALFVPTAPHWSVTALLLPIGLSAFFFVSRWLLLSHLIFGSLLCVAAAVYYMLYGFINYGSDGEASRFYGWDQVGARMQQLAAERGAVATLAAYQWEATSKLGFNMKTTDVTSLSPKVDEYDFWRDEAALSGKDMVVVDEFGIGTAGFTDRFASVEPLESFMIMLHGAPLRSYQLYLGHGYVPPEPLSSR